MLPTAGPNSTVLSGLTKDGTAVSTTTSTVKGLEYASFSAAAGNYSAAYAAPVGSGGSGLRAAPSLAQIAAASSVQISDMKASAAVDGTGATATVTWKTTESATSEVVCGTDPADLGTKRVVGDTTRDHSVSLSGLASGTAYYYRVTSTDQSGTQQTSPAAGRPPASVATPGVDQAKPTVSDPVVTVLPDGTAQVSWTTDKPTDSDVRVGPSQGALTDREVGTKLETSHQTVLSDLAPNSTYWVSTTSRDAAGNTVQAPTVPVVTPGPGVAEQTWPSFRRGSTSGQATIGTDGLGSITLAGGNDAKRRTGSFTSGVLDAQAMVDWDRLTLHTDVPDGAKLTVRVRTGSTATPDRSWSSWRAVSDGERVGGGSRYIQYQVDLAAKAKGAAPPCTASVSGTTGSR